MKLNFGKYNFRSGFIVKESGNPCVESLVLKQNTLNVPVPCHVELRKLTTKAKRSRYHDYLLNNPRPAIKSQKLNFKENLLVMLDAYFMQRVWR